MKLIRSFNIPAEDISASTNIRQYRVGGDNGAIFSLQIKNSSGQYYNFATQLFTTAITADNKLVNIELTNNEYHGSISFPANASGDTYTITLFAEPHFKTELNNLETVYSNGLSFSDNLIHQVFITQVADTTITFTPTTATSSKFATLPSNITASSSPRQPNNISADIDWDFKSADLDSAYGLVLARQPLDTDFYVTVTGTVDGAISGKTRVVLDDATNLIEGLTLHSVSSGSLAAATIIGLYTDVGNSDWKRHEIELSAAQTFADGITLTFRAWGSRLISQLNDNMGIKFEDLESSVTQLTKTVRTTATGTTININGTRGISAGDAVTVRGIDINNSATNVITGVSGAAADSGAGSITMTLAQTIKVGSKIYIDGCGLSTNIKGKIILNKFPSSNTTIYLDVDNIFTPGVAS